MTNEVNCNHCGGRITEDEYFLNIGIECYHKVCVEVIKFQSSIKDNWITLKESRKD